MSLAEGTRIGPYEILGSLGAGGMGEVCRARDTKLGRDVALKVLPDAFATDRDRMARFQREAQLLAALNHPNIAAIYGLEDAGSQPAIVMELVEGATIAGPLPMEDALRISKQIAEAIEYAHDRGIIHRDLKPANIKVTPDGTVKVLDFGLAKAMDDVSDSVLNMAGSMSPTLSLGATYAGVIMGTASYMAPEQAKGRPADRRSDVWAFGIVLYEMLTGDQMFGGDSVPETLASVIKDPIAFSKLPDDTPHSIRKLVARCLERDPRRRLQSIGEARIVIDDVIAGVPAEDHRPAPAPQPPASKWPWGVAGAAVLASLATLGWVWSRPAPAPPAVARFTLSPTEGTTITNYRSFASNLAVSPDGRYVVFVADEPGRERTLWIRAINSLSAQRLDRTEDAVYPFWSPDSQQIAYFAKNKLMRISVAGGAPLPVADASDGEGGAWFQEKGQDGIIVFAANQSGPLKRVPAQGGVTTDVTKLGEGETAHVFPEFLPDGRFFYLARGNKPGIYVQSLNSSERTFVVNSIGRASFSPGFLLYLRDSTLLAHRWNLTTLALEGEPIAIADDVRIGGANGRNAFSVSRNGLLAYRGGGSGGKAQITSYTRDGKGERIVVKGGENAGFALSPDDKRLVVIHGNGDERDLWVMELATDVFSPLTTTPGAERTPVWSPDSRRVAYLHEEGTAKAFLYETAIGSGRQTVIPSDGKVSGIFDWTRDGKSLLTGAGGGVRPTIQLLAAPQAEAPTTSASGKPQTVFSEPYVASQFHVSPDLKWVAYTSQQSGQPEIIVAAFPSFSDRHQISTGGGVMPLWRGDAKELFFLGRDLKLRAVEVKPGTTFEVGPVQSLFPAALPFNAFPDMYAVTRDGKRFYVREPVSSTGGAAEQLYIVANWTSLVAR